MSTITNGQSAGKQVVFKELPLDLNGYEAKYKITSDGRVYSEYLGDFIKPFYSKGGYVRVKLNYGDRSKKYMVHRLVAMAFIPNPDNKPEVNHIDGDKHNNNAENLEWVTRSENIRHAFSTGLMKPSRSMLGRKNPNAGRHGKPIRIIETGEEFNSITECEKAINGNNRHICDCLAGRQKTHKGYHFEYI